MRQTEQLGAKGSRHASVDRAKVVETFLTSGKTVAEVARQHGLDDQTVRDWIRQASDEAVMGGSTHPERARSRRQATPDPVFVPEIPASETESALIEALEAVDRAGAAEAAARAGEAEAVARAEAVEAKAQVQIAAAEAKATKAARALARARRKATDAVMRAEAAFEAEAAARAEIAAVYAAVVEAMVGSEVATQKAVVEAEAAARLQIAAVYAEAVEAIVRAEVLAAERVARAEAAAAGAVALVGAASARLERACAEEASTDSSMDFQTQSAAVSDMGPLTRAVEEAAARSEIAALVSQLKPVEVWVQVVGRTLAEARRAALDELGVEESQAELEVLDKGSRWLPGRVRVRARIRVPEKFNEGPGSPGLRHLTRLG